MTPEDRPFRFGMMLDTTAGARADVVEAAQRAEAAGVDVLLATDHLGRLAALPVLQAAAEVTGLRIGTFVLNNDLRHPTVLAQHLTTLDVMTDGRLEIGIGAGWNRPEYEAAGISFDPPPERLRRMKAAVAMLRQAMRDGRIEHEADDAYPAIQQRDLPASVQRPHPPIMVGGGGPRMLAFAAREADIVGIDPRASSSGGADASDTTEAAIDRKIGWVREAAGDRWPELEINISLFEVDPEFHRRSGPAPPRARGIAEDEVAGSPHFLVGDTAEMVDTLIARRERWGLSYVAMRQTQLEVLRPVVDQLADR